MVPGIRDGMFESCILLGIRPWRLILDRFMRKIGIANLHIWPWQSLINSQHEWMTIGNIKEAARLEIMRDNLPPRLQIGQPANGTIRGIDDIELACRIQYILYMVNIAANKGSIQV